MNLKKCVLNVSAVLSLAVGYGCEFDPPKGPKPDAGGVEPDGPAVLDSGARPDSAPDQDSRVGASETIELTAIGTYETGVFDEGGAEIVAYDPQTRRLFVVNGGTQTIDVISIADPTKPSLEFAIEVAAVDVAAKSANSVAFDAHGRIVAAAIENTDKQAAGFAAFFDVDGHLLSKVTVGSLPDMITFTPDGNKVLVANEGEPSDDYTVDPEGSVSIVDVSRGVSALTDADVTTAGFADYNGATFDESVRVFGPAASPAQDFEPEYIAVSHDSKTAWVTLQENNALATLDIESGAFTAVKGFGFHAHEGGFDASDEDGTISIRQWPCFGLYQPDAIASYRVDGETILITANEGDSRDYDGFSEEARVADITLDPDVFPNAAELQAPEALGRLKVTNTLGDEDGDGDYDALYSFGTRSFSFWSPSGELLFDSDSALEQLIADVLPDEFNSSNDANGSFDDRSDDKGPEPEGLALGEVNGRTYLFVGLERIGGVVVYDLSVQDGPAYVTYANNRNFSGDAEAGTAGDLGPEGLVFIPAGDSPTDEALLVVANEVSGTTTVYAISVVPAE